MLSLSFFCNSEFAIQLGKEELVESHNDVVKKLAILSHCLGGEKNFQWLWSLDCDSSFSLLRFLFKHKAKKGKNMPSPNFFLICGVLNNHERF